MELKRAAQILAALADGRDPVSDAPLKEESVFNSPEVIRALHCVLRELEMRPQMTTSVNAGRVWSDEEEQALLAQFSAGMDTAEIARLHGRTTGAVETRLSELGKKDQIRVTMR